MSVGVEMTSYLRRNEIHIVANAKDVQLDDVRMPQGAHVVDLPLHPDLRLRRYDCRLGEELHRDLLASDRVVSNCRRRCQVSAGRRSDASDTYF